jgi:hypothetical protein
MRGGPAWLAQNRFDLSAICHIIAGIAPEWLRSARAFVDE